MTNEEDDLPFGGPPPDPSQRQWRHPSELAAAAAAAARLEAETGSPSHAGRLFSATSFIIGGSVGIAACIALYALSTSFSVGLTESDLVAFPVGSNPFDDLAPSVTTAEGDSSATLATTALSSTTINDSATSSSAIARPPDRQPLPTHLEMVVDNNLVAVHLDQSETPSGSGLLIGGMILTSASIIGDEDSVTVVLRNRTVSAEVVGTDPFSDLAVLVPSEPIPESGSTIGSIATVSVEDPDGASATESLAGITITLLATDGQPEPIAVTGKVIAVDQQVQTRGGHPVVGALSTSARLPEGGAGAVLVNDAGDPVGLVIDGLGPLATAIPLTIASEIAQHLVDTGWATSAWLGIEGRDLTPGVEVLSVREAGPAAQAGLLANDIIRRLGGVAITDMASLVHTLRQLMPGDEIAMRVLREGGYEMLDVVVGEYPLIEDAETAGGPEPSGSPTVNESGGE